MLRKEAKTLASGGGHIDKLAGDNGVRSYATCARLPLLRLRRGGNWHGKPADTTSLRGALKHSRLAMTVQCPQPELLPHTTNSATGPSSQNHWPLTTLITIRFDGYAHAVLLRFVNEHRNRDTRFFSTCFTNRPPDRCPANCTQECEARRPHRDAKS